MAPVLFAAAIAILFTNPGLASPWLLVSWLLLGAGFILSPKALPPWPITVGITVIVVSAILAVPISALNGGRWPQTLALAMLTLPLPLFALCRSCTVILERVVPLTLAHAGLVFFQGVPGAHRVDGFADNANVAGSALVLGAIYYLTRGGRGQWLAVPLMMAIPFTGARWAVVILAVAVAGLVVARRVPLRTVAAGVLAGALVAVPLWSTVWGNFVDRAGEGPAETARLRLQPGTPSLVPQGFVEGDRKGRPEGSHSVPFRMAQETGILSALAWIGVTAYALWRRPRFTTSWWLLVAVGGLSLMYYSTWVGPLGALWWLLLTSRGTAGVWATGSSPGSRHRSRCCS